MAAKTTSLKSGHNNAYIPGRGNANIILIYVD
jgi:hypothetical protein